MAQQSREDGPTGSNPTEKEVRKMLDALMGASDLATLEARDGEIVEIQGAYNLDNPTTPDNLVRVVFPEMVPIEGRGTTIEESPDVTLYKTTPNRTTGGYKMLLDMTHGGVTYGLEIHMNTDPEEVR